MSKKKIELEMFLHRKADGTESLNQWDHTNKGADTYWLNELGACMGKVTIIGEYEDIEGDPREKLIEGLESAIEKERGDSQARVNLLMERISQLKCITHEAAES